MPYRPFLINRIIDIDLYLYVLAAYLSTYYRNFRYTLDDLRVNDQTCLSIEIRIATEVYSVKEVQLVSSLLRNSSRKHVTWKGYDKF